MSRLNEDLCSLDVCCIWLRHIGLAVFNEPFNEENIKLPPAWTALNATWGHLKKALIFSLKSSMCLYHFMYCLHHVIFIAFNFYIFMLFRFFHLQVYSTESRNCKVVSLQLLFSHSSFAFCYLYCSKKSSRTLNYSLLWQRVSTYLDWCAEARLQVVE